MYNVRGLLAAVVLGLGMMVLLTTRGCSRIEPGHVGIKVKLAGSDRGVQNQTVLTGWVFFNRFTEQVFEWPIYVQTASWTDGEALTFNSKEGMLVGADISLSYQLAREHVPAFYVKFRSDRMYDFTHGFLRNVARDLFNEVAGKYGVEEIYGPKKEEFTLDVKNRLNERMAEIGIHVEQFGFIGAPRIPENVVAALNSKVQATQDAMRAENELREATARAKIAQAQAEGGKFAAVQKAEGDKLARLQAAEADKQERIKRAEGEAEANRKLAASITPALMRWRELDIQQAWVNQWTGGVPQFIAGDGKGGNFLFQLPAMASPTK